MQQARSLSSQPLLQYSCLRRQWQHKQNLLQPRDSPFKQPHSVQVMNGTSLQERPSTSDTASRSLWERIEQVYRSAESSGAISKIHSSPSDLIDTVHDLRFVLQIAESLRDKPKDNSGKQKSKERTPDVFESIDQDLTVDNAFTPTHMLRLNKFNVVPYHSLTITRQFESQHAPLTLGDWEATFKVMQAYPEGSIAYYNSGEEAGASQPRKHLQILPACLQGRSTAPLTFESVIHAACNEAGAASKEAVALHELPFQSFGTVLPERYSAADLGEACSNLLAARPVTSQQAALNILTANRFMMLVPRSQESFGPVSCNALVFAGTMLVRSQTELDFIRDQQPMTLLKAVTFPW